MLFRREGACFDLLDIAGKTLLHDLSGIGEMLLDELRLKVREQRQLS